MLSHQMKEKLLNLFQFSRAKKFALLRKEAEAPTFNLEGLKIINNTPLTMETLYKCASLISSKADVTISFDRTLPSSQEALQFLEKEGIKFFEAQNLRDFECDIVLDCNGGFSELVNPRLGFSELTGSGKHRFLKTTKPVVNVDDSETKTLETFFGTGESLLRALKKLASLSEEDLKTTKAVIFGFGKVGKGVVHGLSSAGCSFVIVDPREEAKQEAQGLKGCIAVLKPSEKEKVRAHLESSQLAVTATGIDHVISNGFEREDFKKTPILANMGAVDEFGPKFPNFQVLNNKFPVNFALKEPTIPLFLDPIFLAHNRAALLLAEGKAPMGFHPLNKDLDLQILKRWCSLYPDFDISPAFGKSSPALSQLLSKKAS